VEIKMMIDDRLTAPHTVLQLIELNRLLDEHQQQMLALQRENSQLRRINSGLKNRLQLSVRSAWGIMQTRKSLCASTR
jgi:hypothetical protein